MNLEIIGVRAKKLPPPERNEREKKRKSAESARRGRPQDFWLGACDV